MHMTERQRERVRETDRETDTPKDGGRKRGDMYSCTQTGKIGED